MEWRMFGEERSWSSYARPVPMAGVGSAEREGERLQTTIREVDLECPIDDRSRLSDQLIQTLFGDCASAAVIRVETACATRGLSIN